MTFRFLVYKEMEKLTIRVLENRLLMINVMNSMQWICKVISLTVHICI